MDNPMPGRPKNTNRIPSQGEEPRIIHSSRCNEQGHERTTTTLNAHRNTPTDFKITMDYDVSSLESDNSSEPNSDLYLRELHDLPRTDFSFTHCDHKQESIAYKLGLNKIKPEEDEEVGFDLLVCDLADAADIFFFTSAAIVVVLQCWNKMCV
nr:transposase, MuDR, MULE transposase domain protein [Tanacetum cinerariifolium]